MDYPIERGRAGTRRLYTRESGGCIFYYHCSLLLLLVYMYRNINLIICRIKMCLTPYVSHGVHYYNVQC